MKLTKTKKHKHIGCEQENVWTLYRSTILTDIIPKQSYINYLGKEFNKCQLEINKRDKDEIEINAQHYCCVS